MPSLNRNKESHVLNVAENTHVRKRRDIVEPVVFSSVRTVTFILIAARNLLIKKRRSIHLVNILLNNVLNSPNSLREKVKLIFF